MKQKVWLVTYEGNHTGKYYNEVVGICNTEKQAIGMIDDLVHEDLTVYDNIGTGLDFKYGTSHYEYRNGDILYSYKVTSKYVYVNFVCDIEHEK